MLEAGYPASHRHGYGLGAASCTAAQGGTGRFHLGVAQQPLFAERVCLLCNAHLQGALVCAQVAGVQVQQAAVGGSHRLLSYVQSAVAIVGCLADQQRGQGLWQQENSQQMVCGLAAPAVAAAAGLQAEQTHKAAGRAA